MAGPRKGKIIRGVADARKPHGAKKGLVSDAIAIIMTRLSIH